MFDRSSGKVLGFVTACKLYIRMKMRSIVSRRTNFVIYTRRISRYLEGKYLRRFKRRIIRI